MSDFASNLRGAESQIGSWVLWRAGSPFRRVRGFSQSCQSVTNDEPTTGTDDITASLSICYSNGLCNNDEQMNMGNLHSISTPIIQTGNSCHASGWASVFPLERQSQISCCSGRYRAWRGHKHTTYDSMCNLKPHKNKNQLFADPNPAVNKKRVCDFLFFDMTDGSKSVSLLIRSLLFMSYIFLDQNHRDWNVLMDQIKSIPRHDAGGHA